MDIQKEVLAAKNELELIEGVLKVLDQVAMTLVEVDQVIAMLQPRHQIIFNCKLNALRSWASNKLA